jgi:hypothetical protein
MDFVLLDLDVAGDQHPLLPSCLGDQESVEGVVVMTGKLGGIDRMLNVDRQLDEVVVGDPGRDVSRGLELSVR